MILRVGEVVIQQLGGLGLLQRQVVFHDDALHEVLVDDFTVPLPRLAVVRDQYVVAARDQVVRHVAVRPVAVDAGFLVQQLLDHPPVCQYDPGPRAEFQREDPAVLFRPFGESICYRLLVRRVFSSRFVVL